MGLMSFIKSQVIDIIEWLDDSGNTLVYRFPDDDHEIKNGAKLTVDQFMVASEAGVNIQNALIEAAENGDKKAQMMLNMQGAARRN